MRKPLALLMAGSLLLAGCGGWSDSRINPGNWFGKSKSTPVATAASGDVNPLIPEKTGLGIFDRPEEEDISLPARQISELRVEPTPNGAIIYATAIAARQGGYDLALKRVPDTAADTLEYTFNVVYPEAGTPTGNEHSRTLRAAVTLSEQDLRGIRTIRVSGAENARETRRR
ncbi:hypothetical protein [Pseudophaeobacter sp.]|jgi:hypothetical protein|uniref:hypothetical protein n=1 Tax=Pseudophaeobacter sp. TaxID=1971739 RepID=UPI003A97043C